MADIEHIQRLAAAGYDVWDMLVSVGQSCREDMDVSKWQIGDAVQIIRQHRKYGANMVARYARDINLQPDRAYEYGRVAGFYPMEHNGMPVRANILDSAVLSYSHAKKAMRLKDLALAMDFLRECEINAWSTGKADVELARMLGKPTPPAKVLDAEGAVFDVLLTDDGVGRMVFEFAPGVNLVDLESRKGQRLRVVLRALESDAIN